jgi:hypothetical protein
VLRLVKWLFVGGPALLLLGVVACQTIDSAKVRLEDPADVSWGEGSSAIRVHVAEGPGDSGEIRTFHVEAHDARGQIQIRRSLDVNEDQWGGGFVGAMQVDDDPELEVVVWGAHESDEECFFLDYEDGAVKAVPFYLAHDDARARAIQYHHVHKLAAGGVTVLVFLGAVYYLGLALLWPIVRMARHSTRPATPPAPAIEGETI